MWPWETGNKSCRWWELAQRCNYRSVGKQDGKIRASEWLLHKVVENTWEREESQDWETGWSTAAVLPRGDEGHVEREAETDVLQSCLQGMLSTARWRTLYGWAAMGPWRPPAVCVWKLDGREHMTPSRGVIGGEALWVERRVQSWRADGAARWRKPSSHSQILAGKPTAVRETSLRS